MRSQDGDKRAGPSSAQALASGALHLKRATSSANMMAFVLVDIRLVVCLVWAGYINLGVELERECVMHEGVTSAVGMLQVSGQRCLILSISCAASIWTLTKKSVLGMPIFFESPVKGLLLLRSLTRFRDLTCVWQLWLIDPYPQSSFSYIKD